MGRSCSSREATHLAFLLFIACLTVVHSKRVLLISFDGFRYDLLNATMAPTITQWALGGAWFINGSQSQYVTYTAPNHVGIVTGLREEEHGIVSNYFYDPPTKQHYDIFNLSQTAGSEATSLNNSWYKGEPIWLTNARAGGKSAVMYWPTVNANWSASNKRPEWSRSWKDYGNLTTWQKDVDDLVQQLQDPHYNFAALYVAEPDHTLHAWGFYYENHLKETVNQLDQLFGYLIKRLTQTGLLETTDIILTADHGHAEIGGAKHVLCVPDYVHGQIDVDFNIGDHMIYPVDDAHAKAIHDNLTKGIEEGAYKIDVYYKKDVPPRYHYSSSVRVGGIVLDPAIGYAVSFNCNRSKLHDQYGPTFTEKPFHSSTHGMDPEKKEMRAFLVMRGPSFFEGKNITEVPENIDLYGLMAQILGAEAAPNNGTMKVVQKALRGLSANTISPSTTHAEFIVPKAVDSLGFLFFVVPSIIIVALFFAYAWRRTVIQQDPTWAMATDNRYKPLNTVVNEAFENSPPELPRRDTKVSAKRGTLLDDSDTDDDF